MDGNYNNKLGEEYEETSSADERDENIYKEESYKEPKREYVCRDYVESKKTKKKSFRGSLTSYIAIALVASIIGGLVSPYIGTKLYGGILPEPNTNKYMGDTISINPTDNINTVSAVAKKAMSSVVGITTIEEVQQFWFQPIEREGIGSGVIVGSNGYILTNSHVVADGQAKSVNVLFENGEKDQAEVLWNDSVLDLAIVKVNKTGLPVADLGDSDNLEIGEIAVAIGNPLGLEFQRTVTSGIISGINRSIQISENRIMEDLIQTDASINPGNSGGPLLNGKGQVIGINTAKVNSGEGLGFAIPINKAKEIVEQVLENGSYKTVFLGISSLSVKEYEGMFGVDFNVDNGVIIIQVHKDTPAYRAGLLNGDIITKIGDTELENMNDLKKVLYKYRQGDEETLIIVRNGEEMKINIEFSDVK